MAKAEKKPKTAKKQAKSRKTTDLNAPNSSVSDAQAIQVAGTLPENAGNTPAPKKKVYPKIPQIVELTIKGRLVKMVRTRNRKLTEKQLEFIRLMDEARSGETIQELLIKAGYSEDRSRQGLAGAGENVKVLIEDLIDEQDLFEKQKALENRVRIVEKTFPKETTNEEIHAVFEGFGEVRAIIDEHDDPWNKKLVTSRKVYVRTIDNTTVANAMDKAYKIKGKYASREEKNGEPTFSLTEVLKSMAKARQQLVQETPLEPRKIV